MTTLESPTFEPDVVRPTPSVVAPPQPPRHRSDRVRTIGAVVAVALCAAGSILAISWNQRAASNARDAEASRARTTGAVVASLELTRDLDALARQAGDLREQVAGGKVLMFQTVDERDRFRDQLAATEVQLETLRAQVDNTYATVLAQGETMALLGDCMSGVGKVLNLAGVDADAAIDLLGVFYDTCVRADAAINGGP